MIFKSNEKAFFRLLDSQSKSALNKMGKVGVDNIKKETPVLSGNLKKGNTYDVKGYDLYFINNVLYAPYVEMGTMYQTAQPFMRSGIINSYSDFTKIMISDLKV